MAKCATCGKDLGLMTHRYKVDGQLYCDDDYKTIQAAKLTEVNDEKGKKVVVMTTREKLQVFFALLSLLGLLLVLATVYHWFGL